MQGGRMGLWRHTLLICQAAGPAFAQQDSFSLNPAIAAPPESGNRLAYLDDRWNPFWPELGTARLTTPQWVGEEGVEAVIVLSIDDLRDPAPYEAFLAPLRQRLRDEYGRTPLSVLVNSLDPGAPIFQDWL